MTDNYEILQALYDVGEKIIEKGHIRRSEDTASGIAKYYKKHCYIFTEETNRHPFTVTVGSFHCESKPCCNLLSNLQIRVNKQNKTKGQKSIQI